MKENHVEFSPQKHVEQIIQTKQSVTSFLLPIVAVALTWKLVLMRQISANTLIELLAMDRARMTNAITII